MHATVRSFVCAALAAAAFGALAAPEARRPAVAPLPDLETAYLECDRVSSRTVLGADAMARCAAIADALLAIEFDGDLDRMLAWLRLERAKAVARSR